MKKVLFLLVLATIFGCEIEKINYMPPIVRTYEPNSVMTNSASLGGIVLSEGGKNVSEYGVVWSEQPHPTPADNKVVKGERLGEFYGTVSGLQPNTTYYSRFYAINEVGVGYGQEYAFKTGVEPPCNPTTNNLVKIHDYNLQINEVELDYPSWAFGDGNIEFAASSWYSTMDIVVQFNETNSQAPLSGEYTCLIGDFGLDEDLSTGQAKLFVDGYVAAAGTKFYVKNENNVLSIIFCDTHVGKYYVLNGKFSYKLK